MDCHFRRKERNILHPICYSCIKQGLTCAYVENKNSKRKKSGSRGRGIFLEEIGVN